MATNRQLSSSRTRSDSLESNASLWEKTYEPYSKTKPDAPFANDTENDLLELDPIDDENEGYNTNSDVSHTIPIPSSTFNISEQFKPWQYQTQQEQLKIIINNYEDIDKIKRSLKNDLTRQGLKWTDAEEELTPWHFGLVSIRLTFTKPRIIDIAMLSLASPVPFWLKLKTDKQKPMPKIDKSKKTIHYALTSDFDISLRCGALTDLNQFYYSKSHSWDTKENLSWSLALDDHRNNGGYIQWTIEDPQTQTSQRKQLLLTNINEFIVIHLYEDGFDIYFNQKCNTNEFEAKMNDNDNGNRNQRNNSHQHISSTHTEKQQTNLQKLSTTIPAQSISLQKSHHQQQHHQYDQQQQQYHNHKQQYHGQYEQQQNYHHPYYNHNYHYHGQHEQQQNYHHPYYSHKQQFHSQYEQQQYYHHPYYNYKQQYHGQHEQQQYYHQPYYNHKYHHHSQHEQRQRQQQQYYHNPYYNHNYHHHGQQEQQQQQQYYYHHHNHHPKRHHHHKQTQQTTNDPFRRTGVHTGSYFPTIQFSLRIKPLLLTNNDKRNTHKKSKEILSLLIEFFLAHKISICYGKINFERGPQPYLFFQQDIPDFPSHIMKYSWQMLSIVGYRLQIQIDQSNFLDDLFELSKEENNPDELFYRVCVYLSRIFVLKPFINITHELQHAINESKRKRDHAAYGLIKKIHIQAKDEAYVPSVTVTPTTIQIKPLKLRRTHRVLRATEQFGTALDHFILVDIRDENGQELQSFHFGHLRTLLLNYLRDGFILMDNNREYKYLHHSQSQLRQRQFWFYHHEKDNSNISFSDAYSWMGTFKDLNPAKYAARMALCFSTTKATVDVPADRVMDKQPDIEITINNQTLSFTDGCGTMSTRLRDEIKEALKTGKNFSAVQFRYNGVKGVVSVHPHMQENIDLYIRKSMNKFESNHRCFEVCKISAPRQLFLSRQAILLLSYRKIPDTSFIILQQQNHLFLIRALLINSNAQKLILQKTPSWFLPKDIHEANIDFIHEPFFRQLLINSCLQSTRELLNRTRIRIPPNKGRNMLGIVDEYNVLKPDEVYVQYTILTDREADDDDEYTNNNNNNTNQITEILHNCKVVITKNPSYHPGDIRTFTAVNYPQLEHLKDVIVFSQQGDCPAPHAISGSDLDGDEYLVVWHEDLVPYHTENAPPFEYDAHIPAKKFDQPVTREDVERTVLDLAEHDYLGRLSKLHLAFADKFGIGNKKRPKHNILSTVELAGKISQEVDSGKTGYHPLNENKIKKLNLALKKKRPDYMDNLNFEQYKSDHVLGKLYRSSKNTLSGWKQLLRYHRHLRHLEIRTLFVDEEDEKNEQLENNDEEEANINLDQSFVDNVNEKHSACTDCVESANRLASIYRQEIMEILNLYGLSHESDLWCRNAVNGLTGEFEDTAYTELEQLVKRTRDRFYYEQIMFCKMNCNQDTHVVDLCDVCRKRQYSIAVACYQTCYGVAQSFDQAPILSLPWLFATTLLQNQVQENSPLTQSPLCMMMKKYLNQLVFEKRRLMLNSTDLEFQIRNDTRVGEAKVDITVCAFIEVLQQYLEPKKHFHWPLILSRLVRTTSSFTLLSNQSRSSDEWELIFKEHKVDGQDMYTAVLLSIDWTDEKDKLIHNYFQDILDICFEEGRRTKKVNFLNISEDIILLLQKIAIKEPIF